MNKGHLEIHFETTTFTFPMKARCRAAHWISGHKDIKDSSAAALVALIQSSDDDVSSCEVALDAVRESFKNYYFEDGYYKFETDENLEDKIRFIYGEINRTLYSLEKSDGKERRLSLIISILSADTMYLGHAGGCRVVLMRDGNLKNITVEPSYTPPLGSGTLSMERARQYQEKLRDMSMLGNELPPAVDVHRVKLRENDAVLFLTDGISEVINDNELVSTITGDLKNGPARIITLSTDRAGDTDNTLILMAILKGEHSADEKPQEKASLKRASLERLPVCASIDSCKPDPYASARSKLVKNLLVLLASMTLTVFIGLVYFLYSQQKELEKPVIIYIQSLVPMKSVLWNGKSVELENGYGEFTVQPGKKAILKMEPAVNSYQCLYALLSEEALKFSSCPSMERLEKNTLALGKNRIDLKANIFSRVDPINPESEKLEKDGKKVYKMEFTLGNARGALEVSAHHLLYLKGLFITVK
jgi:serine/threonine protein phosphatase PrpC